MRRLRRCGLYCYHKSWDFIHCKRGGGSKPQPPTFITPPPPQITQAPPPNVSGPGGSADELFKAQVQYNPQLTQQAVDAQLRYGPQLAQSQTNIQAQQAPQLAQSQFDIQSRYGPQYRQLYSDLFPAQVQGQDVLAQQALQRLQSPTYMTPEQQAAQEAIRQRAFEQSERGIRESANLGGTLYGGRRELREDRARNELAQSFASQDIALQQAQRDQALRELIASSQVVFPQVQQPGVAQPGAPQFGQGVTPSPDALLGALLQGQIIQQPIYQPGNPGSPGFFQSGARGFSGQSPTFY